MDVHEDKRLNNSSCTDTLRDCDLLDGSKNDRRVHILIYLHIVVYSHRQEPWRSHLHTIPRLQFLDGSGKPEAVWHRPDQCWWSLWQSSSTNHFVQQEVSHFRYRIVLLLLEKAPHIHDWRFSRIRSILLHCCELVRVEWYRILHLGSCLPHWHERPQICPCSWASWSWRVDPCTLLEWLHGMGHILAGENSNIMLPGT